MLVVDVPLNTSLADLDEALRSLLKRELERHGFGGVEIAFEAPSREWSGKLTGPTVNLFLYDLREADGQSAVSVSENRANGRAEMRPPSLRLEATYAITAWTKAIEDEHRLLSQLLSILYSHRQMPADLLEGRLAGAGTIETIVGKPMEEKADFWTAVGGQYKPSVDFAVRMSIESGSVYVRGPEVRTQSTRTRLLDGPRGTMQELHRFGGTILDGEGAPIADAWVTIPELGAWTSSDRDGRYVFDRVQPGSHRVMARTADGRQGEATVEIPGRETDLVLDGARARKR